MLVVSQMTSGTKMLSTLLTMLKFQLVDYYSDEAKFVPNLQPSTTIPKAAILTISANSSKHVESINNSKLLLS